MKLLKTFIAAIVIALSFSGAQAQDSTYAFKRGIVPGVTPVVKWVNPVDSMENIVDTSYFVRPSYLSITPFVVPGADNPAVTISIIPEEGDGISYIVIRYHLYDVNGKELYSNRYRIDGSCYDYYQTQGLQYAYWKVLNDPKTHLTIVE